MFGSQTAEGVICVRGDSVVAVGFGDQATECVVGIVPRRVFLVRFGGDQAHVIVGIGGRVPDRDKIGQNGSIQFPSPAEGKGLEW